MVPLAAAPALTFTPGSLRALAALVATLRGVPSPAPEARHAPRSEPATPAIAAVEQLPARDPPAFWSCSGPTCCSASFRPRGGGRLCEGEPCHERHLAQDRAAPLAACVPSSMSAESTPRQVLSNQVEHSLPGPARRAGTADGLDSAAGRGHRRGPRPVRRQQPGAHRLPAPGRRDRAGRGRPRAGHPGLGRPA